MARPRRPVRNIAARSWCADVRRFFRLINADELLGTHSSPAILTGRIFDDCGNRMSPTHFNKLGVRYRYYVSHAILQQRKDEAGSITRVPAPEIETLVLDGVRKHLAATAEAEPPIAI